jgi:oxygen-independent coproporphyrinogen-3 oxidase
MSETSIYLHIPFCRRRCGYCDFNTFAGFSHAIPDYVKALVNEISFVSQKQQQQTPITTIFFGGGTPSLLEISDFEKIIKQLQMGFDLSPLVEMTLEANPGIVTRVKLGELRQLGFTRVSFGMQSAHPRDLEMLDRQHSFTDVANAIAWSRMAGFEHINLDLIFAIPGQSLERWQESLRLAADFQVDHLSLYSLIIEDGTPMARWYEKGILEIVDEDLSAAMYQSARDILTKWGFIQYEISNYARRLPDGLESRCRHNLNTWRYQPYFGFGAGAHGFIGNQRTENVGMIPHYLKKMDHPEGDWPAAKEITRLRKWDEMQEYMMVGLRLTDEGISQRDFFDRFNLQLSQVFGKQIHKCLRNGLLEMVPNDLDRMRLTEKGRLLGNQVFMEFVGNEEPDIVREAQ